MHLIQLHDGIHNAAVVVKRATESAERAQPRCFVYRLRIVNSGDWCLRLALRTPSGACHTRRRRRRHGHHIFIFYLLKFINQTKTYTQWTQWNRQKIDWLNGQHRAKIRLCASAISCYFRMQGQSIIIDCPCFVCNTVERKRYVVEAFKANPSSSRSLGGDSPNHNQTVSGVKIVARSQILRLCTKFYFGWDSGLCPRPTWESLQRSFITGGATRGLGVAPLFENMGFAIFRNLHTA